jgi:hypothetical protein
MKGKTIASTIEGRNQRRDMAQFLAAHLRRRPQ